jgi:hypothetical protein
MLWSATGILTKKSILQLKYRRAQIIFQKLKVLLGDSQKNIMIYWIDMMIAEVI